jgi:hypothetical protein
MFRIPYGANGSGEKFPNFFEETLICPNQIMAYPSVVAMEASYETSIAIDYVAFASDGRRRAMHWTYRRGTRPSLGS